MELKTNLVHYCDRFNLTGEDNTIYLVNLVDLILNGKLELTREVYDIILEQILVTGAEHKNTEFIRIISIFNKLGEELACELQ